MRHEYRLRLASGLVLALYLVPHLLNHALGIVSLQAAEAFRGATHLVWSNPAGGIVLYGALALHFGLALLSLYRRRTLRMPLWEALQLAFGLLFVPLVATHAVATRGAEELLGIDQNYARTVIFIWSSPVDTWKQVALILVAWTHLVIGLHFWLRLKIWYRRARDLVLSIYVLIPVLALVGFYRAGLETEQLPPEVVRDLMRRLGAPLDEYAQFAAAGTDLVLAVAGALVAFVLLTRLLRRIARGRAKIYVIEHPSGRKVSAPQGQTILEALRAADIPHASVCGGRGRCTTCRIRVGSGLPELPEPSPLELAALQRIRAEPSVRLACQTRPSAHVAITPLLPPTAAARHAGSRGGVAGTERVISVMFIDLRGSTKLGQTRLPYDVLFILNQFFSEMAQALLDTGGHYAQFNGDGLMAIYGDYTGTRSIAVRDGARAALAGGIDMLHRIDRLNERLHGELDDPLRIGIGIHTGEAIVGTMGPPASPIDSAIGDNINVAARLEALTKTLECPMVVSAETIARSEINPEGFRRESVEVRGRSGLFEVYAIDDPEALALALTQSAIAPAQLRRPAAAVS